jgi:uncharacterized protein (TIGR02147 family)
LAAESKPVFAYLDFREYLKEAYATRHKRDRKFSHRFIASRIGVSSSSWFSDLLNRRIDLSNRHLIKLATLFQLNGSDADYFEALVHYGQGQSIEESNHYLRKMLSFKEMKVDLVGQDRFEYYSCWYYSAIRELLFFYDFRGDYASLARKLTPSITQQQAKDGIRLLERLKFIRKDAQGKFKPLLATVKKDSNFKSAFALQYLKVNMELGEKALAGFDKVERHVSTMTLSYSPEAFTKAIDEIDGVRKRLLQLMEQDPTPDKVFQFNIQFFPVTR